MSDDDPALHELTTTLETAGSRLVLRVAGEIDLLTAPAFRSALAGALRADRGLLVDLCDVEFMDSSGLRALLEARRQVESSGVEITVTVADGGPVARLLDLAGVTHLFLEGGGPTRAS